MKPAHISKADTVADVEAYLSAKVEGFALDESAYPEKLGWLLGVVADLLNGHSTLEDLRKDMREEAAK